jgi:sugar phosphate permease
MISNLLQLWQASVHISNLFSTLLLLLVLGYWISVLCGLLDVDTLDLEMDVDGPEAGSSADGHEGLLEYLNLRKVPLSIVVSAFGVSLWLVGVIANHYLHNTTSGLVGLVIFVPNVLISAHVAKFVTMPLVPLFRSMQRGIAEVRDMTGTRVRITSSVANARFGQAEVLSSDEGPSIVLAVRTEGEVLEKGAEAVVVSEDAGKSVYVVSKLEV